MHKLTVHKLVSLNNDVFHSMEKQEHKTLGQAIYSVLLEKHHEDLVKLIKHTDADPYHNDSNIFKCLNKISTHQAMQYYLVHMNHCFGKQFHNMPSVIPGYPLFI